MELYATRHGETNYNVRGLCNDDPRVDVHLTEKGLGQIKTLAEQLKQVQFEVIAVSVLPRTRQTADIINKYHNVTVEEDRRITDNITGFEGKSADEYYEALNTAPDAWAYKKNASTE